MQYPVPQFQDIEDKIIGPLTFKQFIYILGGAGLSYAALQALPTGLNYLIIAPIIGFSLALAFYRINNQPFLNIIESAFYYSIRSKLYLWSHKRKVKKQKKQEVRKDASEVELPNMGKSKIKDLAWSLDINENIDRAESARKLTEHNILSTV